MFYNKCCKCGKAPGWQLRVAIPSTVKEAVRYLASPNVYCFEHRKAGIKADEILDEAAKAFIIQAMASGLPDFPRAFVEWCPFK